MAFRSCEIFNSALTFLVVTYALVFSSCADDENEEPFVASELAIVSYDDEFAADNRIYLKASFSTLDADSIASFGFSYREIQETLVNPIPEADFTVQALNLIPDEGVKGGFSFEAYINPERSSPTFLESAYPLPVCAYIKSKNGRVWASETISIYGDKLRILDVYPQYSAPGTVVRARLSRNLEQGKITSVNGTKMYDATFEAGGETITIDSTGFNNSIYFTMPSRLTLAAPLKIKVANYEFAYGALRNGDNKFTKLSELTRPSYDRLFFAFPGSVYIGGGSQQINGPVLPDFWKFDVASKSWSLTANYPGYPRGYTYTINDNAYCGYPQNLHRYNATNNTWTKVDAPTNDLQYDYTFANSATVVYNGEAYFTNFSRAKTVNDFYWNNFFKFNPSTQKYAGLKAYPGETINSQFPVTSDKSVVYHNKLHFFRNNQHWVYDPATTNWARLKDVLEGARDTKAFVFKGNLYCVGAKTIPGGFLGGNGTSLSLLRYQESSDSWVKDIDIPRSSEDYEYHLLQIGFSPISASETEVYFVLWADTYSLYVLE